MLYSCAYTNEPMHDPAAMVLLFLNSSPMREDPKIGQNSNHNIPTL